MKKGYLVPIVLSVFVFGTVSQTFAQEYDYGVGLGARATTSTEVKPLRTGVGTRTDIKLDISANIEARRAEADARREALRAEAEARRAEARARMTEFRRDTAERRVQNTARVITGIIEHLNKIILRIESRIAKIKARGGDTTESESFVAMAKQNLADAKVAVDAFVAIDLSTGEAEANFERIRALAAEAREHIRAAHQNLMKAVRSLSSIEINVEAGASTE